MELGSIEREMRMDASPEVVFEVLSRPEHICEWWSDEAALEPAPGATGELVWRDQASADTHVARITVVDAEPPRLFSFRWVYSEGEVPARGNSLLVRFELVPVGGAGRPPWPRSSTGSTPPDGTCTFRTWWSTSRSWSRGDDGPDRRRPLVSSR
jgi:uncharacterized protein YndB with AHSA1/START domain